ncbi:unnamed protein product [Lactuca saligna]|uniref:Uncharacterized protein n=1 Tax=Lactuca saligna TaxID=75948 RepID=A0AA35Z4K9_LACSI|nr:unnamed protein product [Lactuca saligna]
MTKLVKRRGYKEERTDKDKEESTVDKGEDFAHETNSPPMNSPQRNSPPRMNKHIHFSTTSSSSSTADDSILLELTTYIVETTKPMIQEVNFPKSASPPHQVDIVASVSTPITTATFHQGD